MDITQDQTTGTYPDKPEQGVPRPDAPDTGSKPDLINPDVPDKEAEPEDPAPEMDPEAMDPAENRSV